MYLVVVAYEDGPSMHYISRDVLTERLNEDYWGPGITWHDDPSELNLESMYREGFIIKGTSVVPEPIQVVTSYKV